MEDGRHRLPHGADHDLLPLMVRAVVQMVYDVPLSDTRIAVVT